jgi:hypothetical protein
LETKRAELAQILKRSELLQKKVNSLILSGNIGQLGFNPLHIDTTIYNLNMQLSRIEEAIENPLGFEMVNGGSISQTPIRPKTKLNILIAGFVSIFAGIFLAFFLEFIQKLKNQQKHS